MLLKYVIYVRILDLTTIFRESLFQICLCNFSWIVDIKLIEDGLQSIFREEFVYINSSCNKLTIIYPFVLCEIKIFNDALNFFLTKTHARIFDCLLKLWDFKESTTICINFFELFLEFLYLISFKMLDKYINCCLLQKWLSSVGIHSSQNFSVHFLLISYRHRLDKTLVFNNVKPWMMQSINCRNSSFWINCYHFLDQILALRA